jgi:hypothetical protein
MSGGVFPEDWLLDDHCFVVTDSSWRNNVTLLWKEDMLDFRRGKGKNKR